MPSAAASRNTSTGKCSVSSHSSGVGRDALVGEGFGHVADGMCSAVRANIGGA